MYIDDPPPPPKKKTTKQHPNKKQPPHSIKKCAPNYIFILRTRDLKKQRPNYSRFSPILCVVMAKILPKWRKTLNNQSINHSIK